jgi:hypothetical protein
MALAGIIMNGAGLCIMDSPPHIRYTDTDEAEAGEDHECNGCAGKKCGIDWRGNGHASDENREAYHGDCH